MRYLAILFLAFVLCGATIVEKDPITGKEMCSYDTKNTDGKVNIDKTRDIYVDGVLYRSADVVIDEKIKSIADVKAELEAR